MDETLLLATDEDLQKIADAEALVAKLIADHYDDAALTHDDDGLALMQRAIDAHLVHKDDTATLEAMGLVLGQVFVARTPMRWVTIEWEPFARDLALQYPGTTLFAFPESMISKRLHEGREVDFLHLFQTVAKHVEANKDDPELQRDDEWKSPVGRADRLDITAVKKDGGVDLVIVSARPLDLHPLTLRIVERKFRNYCFYVGHAAFAKEFGRPSEAKTRVILRVESQPPTEYDDLLKRVKEETKVPAQLLIETGPIGGEPR